MGHLIFKGIVPGKGPMMERENGSGGTKCGGEERGGGKCDQGCKMRYIYRWRERKGKSEEVWGE